MTTDTDAKKNQAGESGKEQSVSESSCCYYVDPCGCYVDPCGCRVSCCCC